MIFFFVLFVVWIVINFFSFVTFSVASLVCPLSTTGSVCIVHVIVWYGAWRAVHTLAVQQSLASIITSVVIVHPRAVAWHAYRLGRQGAAKAVDWPRPAQYYVFGCDFLTWRSFAHTHQQASPLFLCVFVTSDLYTYKDPEKYKSDREKRV